MYTSTWSSTRYDLQNKTAKGSDMSTAGDATCNFKYAEETHSSIAELS